MKVLDRLTILSFIVGIYALYIGLRNLEENREQSASQQDLLNYLEEHLKSQDNHLKSQDDILLNLTR